MTQFSFQTLQHFIYYSKIYINVHPNTDPTTLHHLLGGISQLRQAFCEALTKVGLEQIILSQELGTKQLRMGTNFFNKRA